MTSDSKTKIDSYCVAQTAIATRPAVSSPLPVTTEEQVLLPASYAVLGVVGEIQPEFPVMIYQPFLGWSHCLLLSICLPLSSAFQCVQLPIFKAFLQCTKAPTHTLSLSTSSTKLRSHVNTTGLLLCPPIPYCPWWQYSCRVRNSVSVCTQCMSRIMHTWWCCRSDWTRHSMSQFAWGQNAHFHVLCLQNATTFKVKKNVH